MNIHTFLEHHGIVRNPFAEEDAQTDPVFKEHCISSAYHPIWDKVYGDPTEPSTAVIFGPKGSGKTAMRLQIDRHLERFNQEHPGRQVFVIRYDDFNPFLDHFCERMSRRTTRKPERVLDAWKLWDHMDAILCLAVTKLVDQILKPEKQSSGNLVDLQAVRQLDRTSARDLLLLAACYDQSTEGSFTDRWNSLRKKLRYRNFMAKVSTWFAVGWTIAVLVFFAWLFLGSSDDPPPATPPQTQTVAQQLHRPSRPTAVSASAAKPDRFVAAAERAHSGDRPPWRLVSTMQATADEGAQPAPAEADSSLSPKLLWLAPLLIFGGALPYLIRLTKCSWAAWGIHKHMRVGKREISSTRRVLHWIPTKELASQPLPRHDRTDDRYELLTKLQSALEQLGFVGTIVLMDRVDEPHLLGGKPELMRRFVWPLLDNKLLKHPGLGFKLMLPQELYRDMERETREFHERARLDKQNVIPSFQWTGESLYDLARARMIACAESGRNPEPRDLFDDGVDYQRMLSAFQSLRVPRHLFRFLYRVLVDHCNRHTDADPVYKIDGQTFETVLAVYSRETEPAMS